ncbi:hypothetical protein VPH35_043592 [Triticum aestivum]
MVLTWTLVMWNNLAGIGSYRIIELAGSENHGVGVSAYQTLTRLAVRHRLSRPPPPPPAAAAAPAPAVAAAPPPAAAAAPTSHRGRSPRQQPLPPPPRHGSTSP